MTFIDLFAGIGGFRRGMELAGHKCIGYCEWDKYASASYRMMHTVTEEQRTKLLNMPIKERQKEIAKEEYLNGEWYSNDIRNVDAKSMPKADVWCFGAPCQDFSVAGSRKGLEGDRSSLIREVYRIVAEFKEEDRPEWLIYENVKGMLSSNKGWDFAFILTEMDELGYDIEWQLFNSKDFGVPQNRERVYTIGHLRNRGRRKILPITGNFTKANIKQLGLLDIRGKEQIRRVYGENGLSPCLSTMQGGQQEPKVVIVGNTNPSGNGMNGTVYDSDGLAPCLSTNKGEGNKIAIGLDKTKNNPRKINIANCITAREDRGFSNRKAEGTMVAIPVLTPDRLEKRQNGRRFKEDGEPMFTLTAQDRHGVMVKEATKQGYAIAKVGDSINLEQPNSETRRGRVGKGVAQTLTTSCNQAVLRPVRTEYGKKIRKQYENHEIQESRHNMTQLEPRTDGISNTLTSVQKDNYLQDNFRIRKLTPRECFRLQGWDDTYFDRAASINSDSQLYKQAGNGVTVNVVYEIAKRL